MVPPIEAEGSVGSAEKQGSCYHTIVFKTKVLGFISPKLGLGKLNDPNPRGFERVSTKVVIGMDIIG